MGAVTCAVDPSVSNSELGYTEYEVVSRVTQRSHGTDLLHELELLCQGISTLYRGIQSPTERRLKGENRCFPVCCVGTVVDYMEVEEDLQTETRTTKDDWSYGLAFASNPPHVLRWKRGMPNAK